MAASPPLTILVALSGALKRAAPGWYMQFTDYRIYIALALALTAAALVGLSVALASREEPATKK